MGQLRPIGLVTQAASCLRSACDDQGVYIGSLQKFRVIIEAGHARAHMLAARDRAHGKEPQPDVQRAGRLLQEARELQLGGAHLVVGHVVHQADLNTEPVMAAAEQELFDPAHGTVLTRPPMAATTTWPRSAMIPSPCSMPK